MRGSPTLPNLRPALLAKRPLLASGDENACRTYKTRQSIGNHRVNHHPASGSANPFSKSDLFHVSGRSDASRQSSIKHSAQETGRTTFSASKSDLLRDFDRSGGVSSSKSQSFEKARVLEFLARRDWFLALNSEFSSSSSLNLSSQVVTCFLQNLENPMLALKFYIWISNVNEKLSQHQLVKRSLLDTLWRKGPVVLSFVFLEELKSFSCQITEETLCILISSWGRLGLAKYVNEVFGQMAVLGVRLTTKVYNSVINSLIRMNSLDLAYLKFQQMPADSCLPDRFTYNTLIHGVCKAGIVDEALRLVKKMENSGFKPNVFTYTMLVDGFCNARKVEAAVRVLETMKERNVAPNEVTYRSLIHGSFRCLVPNKACEMLIGLLERDLIPYEHACDTILYCLSNNNMERESMLLVCRMTQKDYHINTSTLALVVTCALKGNAALTEVSQLLDDFIKRGGKPGFNTYLMVIKSMLQKGLVAEADRYINQMIEDKLLSTIISYNMLIDCLVKSKMLNKAMNVFENMRMVGFLPNLVTFNTLICGFSKAGDINMARSMLKMLLEHGFKPDVVTFSSIIDGLCQAHHMDDAFQCLNEMIEWGVSPNLITYNTLIRSLCAVGDVHKSMDLWNRMKKEGINPDIFSFNALIRSFCKMRNIERAQNLFDSMLRFGVVPDIHTYNAFIKALCDAKKIEDAKGTLLIMEVNGCNPNSYSYQEVSNALLSMGFLKEAQEFIDKAQRRGVHQSANNDLKIEQQNDRVVNM